MSALVHSRLAGASRRRRRRADVLRFGLLCVEAAIFLLPVIWMLATALKSEGEINSPPVRLLPAQITLDNFLAVLGSPDANIPRWAFNSLFIGLVTSILHVVLCTVTAYPLARMRFWGRDVWFWFLLSSLMVPAIVTLIPLYIMMIQLNWIDTYHALIWRGLPGVFGVFLLRQSFLGIPREYEEAARIDGANVLQVIRHVIVPLSVPALVTLLVFAFLGSWNDYVWPLFVVHGDMQTLPVGLSTFSNRFSIEYGKLMAAAAITAVPVLIAYLFAQRYIEQGVTATGLKE